MHSEKALQTSYKRMFYLVYDDLGMIKLSVKCITRSCNVKNKDSLKYGPITSDPNLKSCLKTWNDFGTLRCKNSMHKKNWLKRFCFNFLENMG